VQRRNHPVHVGLRLAHAQAADPVAGKPALFQRSDGAFPQVQVQAPLHDAEERLIAPPLGILATGRPLQRAIQRRCVRRMIGRLGSQMVERHDDVRPERLLHRNRPFWTEHMPAAVEMRTERHRVVGNVHPVPQTIDLIPAAVSEDGSRPAHEAVETAKLPHHVRARPQHQVVRIRQHDLRAKRAHLVARKRLDAGLRRNRHEGGRGN
jgi:hypothetical protein